MNELKLVIAEKPGVGEAISRVLRDFSHITRHGTCPRCGHKTTGTGTRNTEYLNHKLKAASFQKTAA